MKHISIDALPTLLEELGAASRHHLAALSLYGVTPKVTFDPRVAMPAEVVEEIILVLERLHASEGARARFSRNCQPAKKPREAYN